MSIDLEREKLKLLWLKEKLAKQEQWVLALESRTQDPLDLAFDREMGATNAQVQTPAREDGEEDDEGAPEVAHFHLTGLETPARVAGPWSNWTREVRRLSPKWAAVIEYIGPQGKSLREVLRFVESNGLQLSPDTVRAGLMNYRRDFGLLENPKRGRYIATQKALDIIAATKDESLTNGEASESQSPEKEAAHTA
jgi:hypothetical protein